MKRSILFVAAMTVALTACGPDPIPTQQAYVQQPPQVVQQPVVVQNDHSDAVMAGVAGAAAGYMLGQSNNRSYQQPRTIVRQKVIVVQPSRSYQAPRKLIVTKSPSYSSKISVRSRSGRR